MTRRSAPRGALPIPAANREHRYLTQARAEALAFNLGAMAAGALPSTHAALAAAALLGHAVVWDLRRDLEVAAA